MPLNEMQQKFVEDNMGLVGTVIKENVNNVNNLGIFTYQDIFQIGCVGLTKAAINYKPGRDKLIYDYLYKNLILQSSYKSAGNS